MLSRRPKNRRRYSGQTNRSLEILFNVFTSSCLLPNTFLSFFTIAAVTGLLLFSISSLISGITCRPTSILSRVSKSGICNSFNRSPLSASASSAIISSNNSGSTSSVTSLDSLSSATTSVSVSALPKSSDKSVTALDVAKSISFLSSRP